MIVIFMGVSGSGKTFWGEKVARILNYEFIDADSFHTPAHIEKMRQGVPLSDDDREPWLKTLNKLLLDKKTQKEENIILACSMLKSEYRETILSNVDATIIYLKGSFDFILTQLKQRPHHFFPPSLLQSQFDILEVPKKACIINIEQEEQKILDDIVKDLKNSRS